MQTIRDDVLDVDGMADLLGMTPKSLYTRRSRNPKSLPPAVRIGRRIVWRRQTVDAWLAELERKQNRR